MVYVSYCSTNRFHCSIKSQRNFWAVHLIYVTWIAWHGCFDRFCQLKKFLPPCRRLRSEPRPCTSPSRHRLGSHQPGTPSPRKARLLRGNWKRTDTQSNHRWCYARILCVCQCDDGVTYLQSWQCWGSSAPSWPGSRWWSALSLAASASWSVWWPPAENTTSCKWSATNTHSLSQLLLDLHCQEQS